MEKEIKAPFNISQLNIVADKYAIYTICRRIERGEIDLSPEFQRSSDLWDEGMKSRLIESILIGIPLPLFYFDVTNNDKWIIIDGLQRLCAFRDFIVNKSLKLTELEFLKHLEGMSFDQIDAGFQRDIEETTISAYLLKAPTPPDAKFNIFKRINTGGLSLSLQEIRNALFPGKSQEFLKTLSNNKIFKYLTFKGNAERMEDREYCLRYIGFVLYPKSREGYGKNVDEFLNDVTIWLNNSEEKDLDIIKESFYRDLDICCNIFHNLAFRKLRIEDEKIMRGPVNAGIFQAWLYIIHNINNNELETLLLERDDIINKFITLCRLDNFIKIRATDLTSTNTYIKLIKENVLC
jgi:hypothetical protein